MIGAIHQIEELLQESYAIYPVGKVPKVDAMRQRVQNIVDLQRATADRYTEIYGTIVDNYGTDVLQTVSSAFGSSDAASAGAGAGPPGYDTMPQRRLPRRSLTLRRPCRPITIRGSRANRRPPSACAC